MSERGISAPAFFLALTMFVVCMLAFIGCGKKSGDTTPSASSKPEPKAFDPMALELSEPGLIDGRKIWMATCSQCHLTGLGGAPKIGDVAAWSTRIAKGKETLYKHAIEGFIGPSYNQMPPKGGFTDLTDEEVKLAVDFVTYSSK
ncbi:MAG: c-type cytochrome [Opitutales bacterium]